MVIDETCISLVIVLDDRRVGSIIVLVFEERVFDYRFPKFPKLWIAPSCERSIIAQPDNFFSRTVHNPNHYRFEIFFFFNYQKSSKRFQCLKFFLILILLLIYKYVYLIKKAIFFFSGINYLLLLTEVLLLLRLEIIESPRLTTPLWVMLNARNLYRSSPALGLYAFSGRLCTRGLMWSGTETYRWTVN